MRKWAWLLVFTGLVGCGRAWRQPVAAALLAAQVTAGVIRAIQNKNARVYDERSPCPIPAPPTDQKCLAAPQRHSGTEGCAYFCFDHCSYHFSAGTPRSGASPAQPRETPGQASETPDQTLIPEKPPARQAPTPAAPPPIPVPGPPPKK